MALAPRAAPGSGGLCVRWPDGAGMGCFWLDARLMSFVIQVLLIWSIMTAGIRAALEGFPDRAGGKAYEVRMGLKGGTRGSRTDRVRGLRSVLGEIRWLSLGDREAVRGEWAAG